MRASRRTRLDRVAEQFEAWRRTRSRARCAIPDELLRAAVGLADEYSATAICAKVRLNPSRFREAREALVERRAKPRVVVAGTPPQFVELSPVPPPAEAPSWRVLIRQADGLRVRLEFRTVDESAVDAARQIMRALAVSERGRR